MAKAIILEVCQQFLKPTTFRLCIQGIFANIHNYRVFRMFQNLRMVLKTKEQELSNDVEDSRDREGTCQLIEKEEYSKNY